MLIGEEFIKFIEYYRMVFKEYYRNSMVLIDAPIEL